MPRTCRPCRNSLSILALLAAAQLTFPACALFRRYDMTQIHQESAARPERHPVIFIHGFLGSKLRNGQTQEGVWGRFSNAIKTSREDGLGLPIDRMPIAENRDELVPYALYESVAGVKFYGALLETMQKVGGYRLGDIDNPKDGDSLFVFTYDWRRDNVESAQRLSQAIRLIKTRLGAPEMRFDLVAHSMGGLVALYYLKYGDEDVLRGGRERPVSWAGAPDLGRVILVGAPINGTMAAFKLLNTGLSRAMSPEEIFTMPSVYQLFPHDGRGHLIDASGQRLDIDLYDAGAWEKYGWSVFARQRSQRSPQTASATLDETNGQRLRFLQSALDRARAFHEALDRDSATEPPVPVHLFGSDCIPTLDKAILSETASGPVLLFDGESTPDRNARRLESLLKVPGDGTVTAASLMSAVTSTSPYFVCESHGMLPTNPQFQDNLFHTLFHGPEFPPVYLPTRTAK